MKGAAIASLMTTTTARLDTPELYTPTGSPLVIVGSYGSGKTEVAVNLALRLTDSGRRVQIADLDIVNPYFRCREALTEMEERGIRVVVPGGDLFWADLPVVLPEIKGMLEGERDQVVLDVGGDDAGARLLSVYAGLLERSGYGMLQVVNANRPFTGTVEGCLKMKGEIEASSQLRVTGIISNTHLMDETTVDMLQVGYELALGFSSTAGIPVEMVTVSEDLLPSTGAGQFDCPVLPIRRRMVPPWRRSGRKTPFMP